MFGSTFGLKAPSSLLRLTTRVYQAPFFYTKTIIIPSIQLAIMFCLMATLCEGENTKDGGYVK